MKNIILTIFILFISNNVIASTRCLVGKDFNEKEVEQIKEENIRFDNEFNELQILVYRNPNNVELKAKLDKNMLRFDECVKSGEIYQKIQLPQNLQGCVELTIQNAQFKKLMKKWQIILTKYPSNKDVIYNNKLLNIIMLKRAGI